MLWKSGADGVQIASRFVATEECDASDAYKQAYINAKAEDITIVMSPVGMPGRALNNAFVQRVSRQREEIKNATIVWLNAILLKCRTASPKHLYQQCREIWIMV